MNSQIEQAIKHRDNYRDFLAALPAFIYNNNIEIFQANLEQMDQEIDRMIEEADDLHARNAAEKQQAKANSDKARMIITKSFAERWTENPEHYKEHFGIDNVEVKR